MFICVIYSLSHKRFFFITEREIVEVSCFFFVNCILCFVFIYLLSFSFVLCFFLFAVILPFCLPSVSSFCQIPVRFPPASPLLFFEGGRRYFSPAQLHIFPSPVHVFSYISSCLTLLPSSSSPPRPKYEERSTTFNFHQQTFFFFFFLFS